MTLMTIIMPMEMNASARMKRKIVFVWQPSVPSSSKKPASAAANTVTSAATHSGIAGTLSVASWIDSTIPPATSTAAAARNSAFQLLRSRLRLKNSKTPALVIARKAGSSPNAAKNWPKLLSRPG